MFNPALFNDDKNPSRKVIKAHLLECAFELWFFCTPIRIKPMFDTQRFMLNVEPMLKHLVINYSFSYLLSLLKNRVFRPQI